MLATFLFKVRGAGAFPVELLCADRCFPHHEHDAACIASSIEVDTISSGAGVELTIELEHEAVEGEDFKPSKRWAELGWLVLDVRRWR
jgi:hypothetical protein